MGAIRECFEESGILLVRSNDGSRALLRVPEEERERARKEIHSGRLRFLDWVKSQGGVVDTGKSHNPSSGSILIQIYRLSNPLHPLGNTNEHPETFHHPNVHCLP
jgi:hypothetical protein